MKCKSPRVMEYEKLQAQAKRTRNSGPLRLRCTVKAPMRAMIRFRRSRWWL